MQLNPETGNIPRSHVTNPSEPQLRSLTSSPRLYFAAPLWLVALVPAVLFALHLNSPLEAVEISQGAEGVLWRGFQIGLAILVVAALLYPPFLPSLRLGLRRVRNRLSVDQGPMYRALEELRHLETAANHVVVARTMRSMGNLRGAVAHVLQAVEQEPDGLAARFLYGCLLREAGQPQAAAEQLARVVAAEANHAFGEAQVQLGLAQLQAGKESEALTTLEKHAAEFGGSRKTFYWIARAHLALGRAEDARAALRRAAAPPANDVRLTPEDIVYRARARVGLWVSRGQR